MPTFELFTKETQQFTKEKESLLVVTRTALEAKQSTTEIRGTQCRRSHLSLQEGGQDAEPRNHATCKDQPEQLGGSFFQKRFTQVESLPLKPLEKLRSALNHFKARKEPKQPFLQDSKNSFNRYLFI